MLVVGCWLLVGWLCQRPAAAPSIQRLCVKGVPMADTATVDANIVEHGIELHTTNEFDLVVSCELDDSEATSFVVRVRDTFSVHQVRERALQMLKLDRARIRYGRLPVVAFVDGSKRKCRSGVRLQDVGVSSSGHTLRLTPVPFDSRSGPRFEIRIVTLKGHWLPLRTGCCLAPRPPGLVQVVARPFS